MLYIIRGLPGSGKSTLAKKILAENPNAVHFEADMYFMDDKGNYNFDAKKLYQAHTWCQSNVEKNVLDKTVVVSNTFTRIGEIQPYIDYPVRIKIIQCTRQYGGIHNVPEEIMEKMRKRFVDNSELKKLYPNFEYEYA